MNNFDCKVYAHFGDNKVSHEVSIVDKNHLPICFYLQAYLDTAYGSKFNTKQTKSKMLLFSYRYFKSRQIDIVNRVKTSSLFTNVEIEDFLTACLYSEGTDFRKNIVLFNKAKISDKQLDRLVYDSSINENRVGIDTSKARIAEFYKYINYLYDLYYSQLNEREILDANFSMLLNKLKRHKTSLKHVNVSVKDPLEKAIPDEVYFELLDIIQVNSNKNPFSKSLRLRNFIIIQTLNQTGIRKGALCKLKISDLVFDWDNPRLFVSKTENDSSDTRRIPALQKTLAHTSSVERNLLDNIKLYIDTERNVSDAAKVHEFIIVSHKGKTKGEPISLVSINSIFSTLSKVLNYDIYPHLMRHKWNEIFEDKGLALGMSHEELNDLRKYACGWSEDSQMVSRYNQFKNAVAAQKMSKIRQNKFMPEVE